MRATPFLGAALALCASNVSASDPPLAALLDGGDPVGADEIQEHVDVLASDIFGGREAGTVGERRAAGYLVSVLEELEALQPAGDDGTWLQLFDPPPGLERMVSSSLDGRQEELEGAELDAGQQGTIERLRAASSEERQLARNVLALLPGADQGLADEVIVVGAHYDHVGLGLEGGLDGFGEIHNGADDNASGSSVLLELAEALATSSSPPRRSVAFQWYSGEEKGLLGSKHWVKHPILPEGARVVAMLNMDMVGRLTGRTLLVGGTGTSPGFPELARAAVAAEGLHLREDPPGPAPSDNSSFYEAGFPALFLFTGIHEDYHRAGDDAHRINAAGAAAVGGVALRLLRALDAEDEAPSFTSAPGMATMFAPLPYLGATWSAGDGGAVLTYVLPGGPADRAGLRAGDVITACDERPVAGPEDLKLALREQPFDLAQVRLVVRRGSDSFEVSLLPVLR